MIKTVVVSRHNTADIFGHIILQFLYFVGNVLSFWDSL